MANLNFSTIINAPREKVWDTMLQDATYRQWTSAFQEGSYYQGSWDKGSDIKFLGPGGDGGMISKVAENRLHEYVSLRHLGEMFGGEEKLYPADFEMYENYTFVDKDGSTEVQVEMVNVPDEYASMFEEQWPKALDKLKEITERE